MLYCFHSLQEFAEDGQVHVLALLFPLTIQYDRNNIERKHLKVSFQDFRSPQAQQAKEQMSLDAVKRELCGLKSSGQEVQSRRNGNRDSDMLLGRNING